MKIWIDLSNSPHVPLFAPIGNELIKRGHEIVWTTRDFAQTVALANSYDLDHQQIGRHGGKSLFGKGFAYSQRVLGLFRFIREKKIDLFLSHNSHEPLPVARLLGIRSINMMDYEHHPANRLSFRLANVNLVPESFPSETIASLGVTDKTFKYKGIKEDIYLQSFQSDHALVGRLSELGIGKNDILIVVRPRADDALYNRGNESTLLDQFLLVASTKKDVKLLVLPRTEKQTSKLKETFAGSNLIIPKVVLHGASLIASADLVVSGGGTMIREAAALGTPAVSMFTGKTAGVDRYLASKGSLKIVKTTSDLDSLELKKKRVQASNVEKNALKAIVDLILSHAVNE